MHQKATTSANHAALQAVRMQLAVHTLVKVHHALPPSIASRHDRQQA